MQLALNILSVSGFSLTFIEIWKPRLSETLEKKLKSQINEIEIAQEAYNKQLSTLSRIANSAFKEVAKGPQLKPPEQIKAEMTTSLINIKLYLHFYFITAFNFLILKPSSALLTLMNNFGNGRVIGGIGLIMATMGLFSF